MKKILIILVTALVVTLSSGASANDSEIVQPTIGEDAVQMASASTYNQESKETAVLTEIWNKTYQADPDGCLAQCSLSATSVQQTKDGGYVLIGYKSYDDLTGPWDFAWIMKADSLGNKQWENYFGVPTANSGQQTIDGGYILAGHTCSSFGCWVTNDIDGMLIKTDSNVNIQWSKIFGGEFIDKINSVQQTKDGGYILAGFTEYKDGVSDSDAWLIKTDLNGNKQWSKTFGGNLEDKINSVQQTKDGGYILAGHAEYRSTVGCIRYCTSLGNAWLVKTDSNGNKQWERMFGGFDGNMANTIRQTKDGGYILADGSRLIKTDSLGNKQWEKRWNAEVGTVQQTKDGGYILAGSRSDYAILIKLIEGSIIPVNLLKNPGFETVNGVVPQYWTKYQTGTNAIFTYPAGRIGKSVAIKYATKETGKVGLWQQSGIAVSPSSQYKLSGYMKLEGVTGVGSSCGPLVCPRYNGASLRINWLRSDGTVIKVDLITKSGTSAWTKYEQIFTAPSNAVKASVGGDLFNSAGKVWFDDLSFVQIS